MDRAGRFDQWGNVVDQCIASISHAFADKDEAPVESIHKWGIDCPWHLQKLFEVNGKSVARDFGHPSRVRRRVFGNQKKTTILRGEPIKDLAGEFVFCPQGMRPRGRRQVTEYLPAQSPNRGPYSARWS